MSSPLRPIIRSVIQGAVGLCSPAEVEEVLEAHLFLEIVPAGDRGDVAIEAVEVLIELYQHLTDDKQKTVCSLTMAVYKLIKIPGISQIDPVAVAAFVLHELATSGHVTGQDVVQIISLPWQLAVNTLTGVSSTRLASFSLRLNCFAHEIEEGFADSMTEDIELFKEINILSDTLRSEIKN